MVTVPSLPFSAVIFSLRKGITSRRFIFSFTSAYALIFWVQNWGLMGVPLLIGWVLNTYCKGPVVDGAQTYDYTLPMAIFACFGVLALIVALMLKAEDKKKGYGLQEANIKK